MIATLLRIFVIHLRRDRVVWLMTFVVPIAFFSIFALVFGNQARRGMPRLDVTVVDEDRSELTARLVSALAREPGLRATTHTAPDGGFVRGPATPLGRADAEKRVRDGDASAAIVLPAGFARSLASFGGERPTIVVLADTSNPVASQMIAGLLQGLVLKAAPELLLGPGFEQLARIWAPFALARQQAIDGGGDRSKDSGEARGVPGLVAIDIVDVLGQKKANPIVAFYAAAIAVLFLLFTAANGAGGSLLDEVDTGTLDRLLSSNLTMTTLLAGKWIAFALLGMLQVSVMFVWGWLVFDLELWSHVPGFVSMTVVTAAATAAFGLMLGTLCRSRAQLGGISATVILLMSAVGGSMFPRFLMSDGMQQAGLFTLNAWALDGYQKVFWRDAPVSELSPQLAVLAAAAAVFLFAARWLARRWEST